MEGSEPAAVEFRMRASDGTCRSIESHYTPLRDAGGRLLEIEGILTDITEKKEATEKIMALARTDAMTGLANRATFIDRLCQERFGPAAVVKAAGMVESRLPSPCLKLQEVSDDAVGELAVRKSVGRLQLEPDDRRGARTGKSPDLCVRISSATASAVFDISKDWRVIMLGSRK